MTNEQLSILLSHLVARLDAAIQHADSVCCDDEPRHIIHQYIGPGMWAFSWTPEREKASPDDWETVHGDVIALDGVREIVRTIEEQVMILRGASQKAGE